ncbi:MAG: hypothetical protein ACXADW_13600 [Candidatus Hodarchaeales archaeon]
MDKFAKGTDSLIKQAVKDLEEEYQLVAQCEYFCHNCQELRLSFLIVTHNCKNCGSTNIILGRIGELNKNELKGKR